MNKMLLGLTAVFALSVAVPAFAAEDKDGKDKPAETKKPEKKPAKKAKKEE